MCGYKMCVIICSTQESLNHYWLEYIKILREQTRYKGVQIARSGLYATEKANSDANEVYPSNQNMNSKPRDELLEIQYKPVDVFSVPYLRFVLGQCNMCPKYCMIQ